jgi:spore maturation protein CgeB
MFDVRFPAPEDVMRPLSILLFSSYGHAVPSILADVSASLIGLGHDVTVVDPVLVRDAAEVEGWGPTLDVLLKAIARRRPDFALMNGLNGVLGFGGPGEEPSHLLAEMDVPCVSLNFDNPLPALADNGWCLRRGDWTFFVWDPAYREAVRDRGISRVHVLPLGTNAATFRPRTLSPAERKRFGGPVSFVGTIPEADRAAWQAQDAPLRALGRAVCRAKLREPGRALDDLLQDAAGALPPDARAAAERLRASPAYWPFYRALNTRLCRLLRRRMLRAVRSAPVRVHDGNGHGTVDYRRELPLVYNGSDVTLNVSAPHLESAVNQRPLDGAACGAFVLSDYRPQLETLFEIGREAVCWHDFRELDDLVHWFLQRPAERRRIAAAARERVLREHTWTHRVQTMLDILNREVL